LNRLSAARQIAPASIAGLTQIDGADGGTPVANARQIGHQRQSLKSGKLLEDLDIPRNLPGGLGADNGRKAA
jgi:hypothetical protein